MGNFGYLFGYLSTEDRLKGNDNVQVQNSCNKFPTWMGLTFYNTFHASFQRISFSKILEANFTLAHLFFMNFFNVSIQGIFYSKTLATNVTNVYLGGKYLQQISHLDIVCFSVGVARKNNFNLTSHLKLYFVNCSILNNNLLSTKL